METVLPFLDYDYFLNRSIALYVFTFQNVKMYSDSVLSEQLFIISESSSTQKN
jgi:hypothetical protein